MRRMILAGGLALAASAIALIAAPVAGATTYNNDTPIIIPAGAENAAPYPSSITVSGTAGPITDVNVGLDGFSHFSPTDVGIVLVAPTGQALMLASCVGDDTDASAVFITLDDSGAGQLPDMGALSTGTFEPADHCGGPRIMPFPGPNMAYSNPGPRAGGTATFASAFNGLSAIGTWNLYVRDYISGEGGGSIPGGWSLDVHPDVTPLTPGNPTNPTPTPAPLAKKCKKKGKTSAAAAKKKGCKKKRKK